MAYTADVPSVPVLPRDGNRQPLFDPTWGIPVRSAPTAFAGGTDNARGDLTGTSNPKTIFRVTGDVLVRVFGVCTTNLAGATATLELGVSGNTAMLIAQTTATDIDANEIWLDATPTVGGDAVTAVSQFVLVNGQDIIETVGTADITSGQVYYVCIYYPLSDDGLVVAA